MKLLKTSKEIGRAISGCIKRYNNISFSVAWIKVNDIYDELLNKKSKIKYSTFGIDFAGTDIKVLNDFKNSDNVKIYKGEYTFHPKIYLFYNNKKEYTVIIGSANLTSGGMGKNEECAVLLKNKGKKFLDDILKTLLGYFNEAKIITEDISDEYSKEYGDIQKNKENVEKKLKSIKQTIDKAPDIYLNWEKVSGIIKKIDFDNRSEILNDIQQIFKELEDNGIKFENIKLDDRRKIIGSKENEYLAFGGLRNAGKAMGILINKNGKYNKELKKISEALENIDVLSNDNQLKPLPEEKVRKFLEVINGIKGMSISTATRLLALKRPDLFLCVNSGNQNYIKELFGFKITGNTNDIKIKKYIQLLKMIYKTDYFNHKLMKDEQKDKALITISKYRVALLDNYLLRNEYK